MSPDEQAIRDLVKEWLRATVAGDADAQRPLMSEDVVFLQPGRPPMRGREAFLAAFKQSIGKVKMAPKSEIQEIRISGAQAWCWNKLDVTITPLPGGVPFKLSGFATSLLEKHNGRWVIVRDSNMLTPEPAGQR
ncbi:MAG TPA: SgcJ/EcaC family oxidoreductase [Planctomycetota bacterium]|nr:SgcJ/EcaC family oxidoreductase [Planctomycetota bacterium]